MDLGTASESIKSASEIVSRGYKLGQDKMDNSFAIDRAHGEMGVINNGHRPVTHFD